MAIGEEMKKKERVDNYAFVDSQNLNLGVKGQGWTLDFGRFRVYLKDKYQITKAFLFIGYVPGNQQLYTALQKYGYILIFKPTLETRKGKKIIIKGNVDAELVMHTMIELKSFNKAIIVSGDGDFHCLVEYLVEKKKLLRLLVPSKHYSSLLRKFSKYIVNVGLMRGKFELKKRGRK